MFRNIIRRCKQYYVGEFMGVFLVEFKNRAGEVREIGRADTAKECWDIVFEFMEEKNYTSYYQRIWVEENKLKCDVGSWTEFFYFSKIDGSTIDALDLVVTD